MLFSKKYYIIQTITSYGGLTMFFKRKNILQHISIQFLFPLLIVFSIAVPGFFLLLGNFKELFHARIENNTNAIHSELLYNHPILVETAPDGSVSPGNSLQFYKDRYVFTFYILDEHQQPVFSENAGISGSRLPLPNEAELAVTAAQTYQTLDSTRGRNVVFSVPTSSYSIVFLFPISQFTRFSSETLSYLRLFVLSLIILLLIDYFILRTYFTSPVKKLLAYIRKLNITSEQPEYLSWSNEIGQLFSAYYNKEVNYKNNIETLSKLNNEKRANELEVLQNQINSHFIYNTLNNIQWLAMSNRTDDVIKTVQSLDILLKACSHNDTEMVSIEEELNYVIAYLTTQKIRFRNIFDFSLDIDPFVLQMKIPKFILQPIVENSIYHGFIDPKRENGHIDIRIKRRGKNGHKIDIEIYDNGIGIEESRIFEVLSNLQKSSDRYMGVAIGNINKRIHLLCGRDYGLGINSRYEHYTKVDITIPVVL